MAQGHSKGSIADDALGPVQQTVRMLTVAVAQIEASILDSETSFNRLSDKFTSIVGIAQDAPNLAAELNTLQQRLSDLQNDVQLAIIDFQFFDRLAQRLAHVKDSLHSLGVLLVDPEALHDPTAWKRLQDELKNRYTMRCETEMFDLLLQGATVDEALQHFRENFLREKQAHIDDGDIDLF